MNLLYPRSIAPIKNTIALGLMLALLLPMLSFRVSAQEPTSSKPIENEHFLLYQDTDGDAVCREANAREKLLLDQIVPKNLRQINHLFDFSTAETTTANDLPAHLTIILRATAHLDANPDAKAAFLRAAAAWENVVNSPVTIYLDADFGTDNFGQAWDPGVLGATSSPSLTGVSYAQVRSNLIAGATAAKAPIYNALPANSVPTDIGTATTVSVSSSIARAIGLLDPTALSTDNAARIGFNSNFSYDFDRSNGITAGQTDFQAVATHEIGHALGFSSRSGSSNPTPIPAIWDLYRFRSGTTNATFTNAQRIMTIGGTTINSQYYFVPGIAAELGLSDGGPSGVTTSNADGNQSSHWRQRSKNGGVLIGIMDPRIAGGEQRDIMTNDTDALSVFGYNSNAVPPPPPPFNDNFVNAQVLGGCSGTANGTNIGATAETGEPNHAGGGGSRSIWYQWQAPVSGNVTITTAGSGFDTVLGVYTGTSVSALTLVAQNDDVNTQQNILTSSVIFPATAGVTYQIAVGGFNNSGSGGDTGPVTLNWTEDSCTNTWSPATLNANQVELKIWTINGRTSAYVKLTFPNAGFRVSNWGTVSQAGNAFSVDATVESFNGPSAQAITNTAQIYDLGLLTAGNYSFAFKNAGTTVQTLNFTITNIAPPANPIDDPHTFVLWQYRDFLRREPDGPGWDHWTAEITMCSDAANRFPGETEAQCVDRKRENTSAAFFVSPEFSNTGYFVLRVYRGSLGRMPHFGGTGTATDEFTRDAVTVGQGIVVNNALAPDVMNANKQAFVNQFVTRTEFRAIYDGLSNAQYVDKLFQTTGVTPSASDRQALIDGLTAGTETKASVLFKVVDGTTTTTGGVLVFNTTYGKAFYDQQFNAAFVQMEYFGYLLRDPDTDGYNFWLGKLNFFGDWVNAQMVRAFINSPEYRSRFGAP